MSSAGNWLSFARKDLLSIELLMNRPDEMANLIAFQCQQCAEKAIKSYLVFHKKRIPKTHALIELIELVRDVDAVLAQKLQEHEWLSDYAVATRYPDALKTKITSVNIQKARTAAETVVKLVSDKLAGSSV
jgi:HEPN domain-containing protein